MGTTSQGIPYPDDADPIASLQAHLQAMAEAVDTLLSPMPETAAGLGLVTESDWTLTEFSAVAVGIQRTIQARLIYSGATITAASAGNIVDSIMLTGLPAGWRPPIPAQFVYSRGGVAGGVGAVMTNGELRLQTLNGGAVIEPADNVVFNAIYLVAP